jgi:hypothetical protein
VCRTLWVIRIKFQAGKQQWLSGGFRAAALGLDRDDVNDPAGECPMVGQIETKNPIVWPRLQHALTNALFRNATISGRLRLLESVETSNYSLRFTWDTVINR